MLDLVVEGTQAIAVRLEPDGVDDGVRFLPRSHLLERVEKVVDLSVAQHLDLLAVLLHVVQAVLFTIDNDHAARSEQ